MRYDHSIDLTLYKLHAPGNFYYNFISFYESRIYIWLHFHPNESVKKINLRIQPRISDIENRRCLSYTEQRM